MPYKSAKYIKHRDRDGKETTNQYVVAVDHDGNDTYFPVPQDQINHAEWSEYKKKGGKIDPYVAS